MSVITTVSGREILDSRGNPTVEVDVLLEDDPSGPRWEYMVVVGETGMNPLADFQLYRDRAGSENPHDELANQWGWGGGVPNSVEGLSGG